MRILSLLSTNRIWWKSQTGSLYDFQSRIWVRKIPPIYECGSTRRLAKNFNIPRNLVLTTVCSLGNAFKVYTLIWVKTTSTHDPVIACFEIVWYHEFSNKWETYQDLPFRAQLSIKMNMNHISSAIKYLMTCIFLLYSEFRRLTMWNKDFQVN